VRVARTEFPQQAALWGLALLCMKERPGFSIRNPLIKGRIRIE
jgi:hypothetical protein